MGFSCLGRLAVNLLKSERLDISLGLKEEAYKISNEFYLAPSDV